MARIIIAEGDSWTAGDIIDPKLWEQGERFVNAKSNDEYRLPRVWPAKLGKLLNTNVHNNSVAGSSNEGILRRIHNLIPKYLNEYRRKDIHVIIGFTSPERRDFCSKAGWDTIYPLQIPSLSENLTTHEQFMKSYAELYWIPEDYLSRYVNTVISLHYFLKALKIKHTFFNAFYENSTGIFNGTTIRDTVNEFKTSNPESRLRHLNIDQSIDTFLSIYDNHFIKTSFLGYIKTIGETDSDKYFDKHHPTEYSHQLWAEYLNSNIELW